MCSSMIIVTLLVLSYFPIISVIDATQLILYPPGFTYATSGNLISSMSVYFTPCNNSNPRAGSYRCTYKFPFLCGLFDSTYGTYASKMEQEFGFTSSTPVVADDAGRTLLSSSFQTMLGSGFEAAPQNFFSSQYGGGIVGIWWGCDQSGGCNYNDQNQYSCGTSATGYASWRSTTANGYVLQGNWSGGPPQWGQIGCQYTRAYLCACVDQPTSAPTQSPSSAPTTRQPSRAPSRSPTTPVLNVSPTAPIDIVTILNGAPSNHSFVLTTSAHVDQLLMYKTVCAGDLQPVQWVSSPLDQTQALTVGTNYPSGSPVTIMVQLNSTVDTVQPVLVDNSHVVAPVFTGCLMLNATTTAWDGQHTFQFPLSIKNTIKTVCAVGSYSATTYNYPSNCTTCDLGYFQDTTGQTSCQECPELDPFTSSQTGSVSSTQCKPSPLGMYSPLGSLPQLCPPYGYETNVMLPSRTEASCENLPCPSGYFCGTGAAIPEPGAAPTDPGYVPPARRMSLMVQVPLVATTVVVKSQKNVVLTVINLDSTRDIRIGFGTTGVPVYLQGGIEGVPSSAPSWPIVPKATTSTPLKLLIDSRTLSTNVESVNGTFLLRWCVVGTETEVFDLTVAISFKVVKILMSPLTFAFTATIDKSSNVTLAGPVPQISIYNTLCNATVTYHVREPDINIPETTCNGPIPTWFQYATPSSTINVPTVFDVATIEEQRGTPDNVEFQLQFDQVAFLSANRGISAAIVLAYCFTIDFEIIGLDATFSQDFTVSVVPLTPCLPGSFSSDGYNLHPCTLCSLNQYQPDSQQTSCLPCPSDHPNTLNNGAALLSECKAAANTFELPDGSLVQCAFFPQQCLKCNVPGLSIQTLSLQPGCWRFDPYSDDIRPCLHAQYCRGGAFSVVDDGNGRRLDVNFAPPANVSFSTSAMCVPNHMGVLCEACVPGTYKRGPQQLCQPCHGGDLTTDAGRVSGLFIGITFGVILLIGTAFYVWKLQDLRKQRIKTGQSQHNATAEGVSYAVNLEKAKSKRMDRFGEAVDLGVKLKIIVGLVQVVGGMSITFAVNLPPFFNNVASIYKLMALDMVSLVDFGCTINIESFKASLLVTTLLPIMITIILAVLHFIGERVMGMYGHLSVNDIEMKKELRTVSFTIFLVILFLCYPSVSSKVLESFHCETFAGTISALVVDPSVICSGPDFESIVGYAALMTLVYVVGIPVFFYWVLNKHRTQINPPVDKLLEGRVKLTLALVTRSRDRRIMHLRFLYKPYKPRFWAFEVFELLRKLAQTSIVVFLPSNSTAQIMFQLGVTFVAVVIFNGWKPYVLKSNSVLATAAQWEIFFMSFITLLLQLDVNQSEYSQNVLGILLMILFFSVPAMALAQLIVELGEGEAYTTYFFCVNWEKLERRYPRFLGIWKEAGEDADEEEQGSTRALHVANRAVQDAGEHHEDDAMEEVADVDNNPLFKDRITQLKERNRDLVSSRAQERAKAQVLQHELEMMSARVEGLNKELEVAKVVQVRTENLLEDQIAASQSGVPPPLAVHTG